MRSLLLSVLCFCLCSGPASAQDLSAQDQAIADEKAAILQDLHARASAAYDALQATPVWSEPSATSIPADLVTGFCATRLGRRLAVNCAALGAATQVDDPLRIARAVGLATGTWIGPADDSPTAQALRDQVITDSQVLTAAVARASRSHRAEIKLSGPALQIAKPSPAPTFASLFPNGIGTDRRAVDRAVMQIVTNSSMNKTQMQNALGALRASLTPEQLAALPDLAAQPTTVDLSGLVGDPMTCDDAPLAADLRPFEQRIITLPRALHGVDDLAGFMVSERYDQPIQLDRISATQAHILLPMHESGPSGGEVAIVLMFADGGLKIARRCAAQFMTLLPPHSMAGTYPEWLDDMGALMGQSNVLADTLAVPSVFPDGYIQDQSTQTAALKAAYANADAPGKFALDALATGLIAQGLNPADARADLVQVTATMAARTPIDEGKLNPQIFHPRFQRRGIENSILHRVSLHEGQLDTALDTFDPRFMRNHCPENMEELDRFIRLQQFGAFADTLQAKVLYTSSGMLMSLSASLGTQAIGGNPKAAEAAGKAVGAAYSAYGIYQGFLKGVLPSSLPLIKADVSNTTIYEDQPDLRITVDRAILVTKSLGWDVEKASIDALTALVGLKLSATGPIGRNVDKLIPAAARDTAVKRALATRVAAGESFDTAFFAARNALDNTVSGVASFMDAEFANYVYGLNKQNGGRGFTTPPKFCELDMLDEEWAMITLDDRDLVYENQSFGVYRPVRDGRAMLNITPRPKGNRFGGLALPTFNQTLLVPPLTPTRVSSPGSVVPGDAFTVEADIANSADPNTQLFWDVAPTGVVSTSIGADSKALTVQTTRRDADFPITGYASVIGNLLPQSDAMERRATFAVQAGGLWLVPTRSCISPGGEVQVFVFDTRTGAEVPARDLVFHTDTAGIEVDGSGLVTSQKKDINVTIYVRGVGANGYRGQVTIRADCTCGVAYFDPDLVVPANTSGPLGITAQIGADTSFISNGRQTVQLPNIPGTPEVFAINGTINVEITGDVNLAFAKPFALDLIAAQAEGPFGPACSYLTGGISGVYLGTQMMMSSAGGLSPATESGDLRPNTYALGPLSFALEDFGGPDDFGTLTPSSGVSVSVMALEPGRIDVELIGQFKGFKYIPFLQGLREDINVSVTARFVSQ